MDDVYLAQYPELRKFYLRHFQERGVSVPRMTREYQEDCFEHVAAVLKPLVKPGELVLDIGCADADFWPYLEPMGVEYVGMDLMPEYAERAKEKHGRDVFVGDAADKLTVRRVVGELGRKPDWLVFVNVFGVVPDNKTLYRDMMQAWWLDMNQGAVMFFRQRARGRSGGLLTFYKPETVVKNLRLYNAEQVDYWYRHGGVIKNFIVTCRK